MGDTDDGENLPPGDDTSSDISAQTFPDLTNLMHDSQISTPVVKLYDSGSTWHISPYKDQFVSLTSIPPKMFLAANKQSFNAIATGDLIINMPNRCNVTKLRLTEVLYSPAVGYILVSIGRLDQLGYSVTFGDGTCTICSPDDDVIGCIPKTHAGLYRVIHTGACDGANAAIETMMIMELHQRMGHISPIVAHRLAENRLMSGLKFDLSKDEPTFCKACVYTKATRKPIAKERVGECATEFGTEVHTDVWGPAPVETIGGQCYYITFMDDKTRLTYLHLLRQKSEAFAAYQDFEAWCCTQHDAIVKVLHSDRGGEYLGKEFIMYLKVAGMKQKLTVHDTPQHNGIAECLNHTLLEKVRAMLHESSLPHMLWGEAVRHAVWLKNQMPMKVLDGGTPLEAATGQKPDLSQARMWGSHIWVHVEGGTKLGGHVAEGRWVGVDDNSPNGCHVYWLEKQSITVKWNIYWDPSSAELLSCEGEEEETNVPNAILMAPTLVPVMNTTPLAPAIPIAPKVQPPPKPVVEK